MFFIGEEPGKEWTDGDKEAFVEKHGTELTRLHTHPVILLSRSTNAYEPIQFILCLSDDAWLTRRLAILTTSDDALQLMQTSGQGQLTRHFLVPFVEIAKAESVDRIYRFIDSLDWRYDKTSLVDEIGEIITEKVETSISSVPSVEENSTIGAPLTAAEIERLAKLAEECAEVSKIAMKILRFGYDGQQPNGNRELLCNELGNLRAAIQLMTTAGDVKELSLLRYGYDHVEKMVQFMPKQNAMDIINIR